MKRGNIEAIGDVKSEKALTLKEIATPSVNPASGYGKIYPKTDGKMYFLDDTGAEQELGGASPLTTKGDLYTFDTDNARLPIGTDGQYLTPDSGEATGLKWNSFSDTTATDTFTSTDLDSAGKLTVPHNLSSQYVNIWVYNDNDEMISPDAFVATDSDNAELDLSGFTVNNTWRWVANKGGLSGGGETLKVMVKIKEIDVTSVQDYVEFAGLDGDSDIRYEIKARGDCQINSSSKLGLFPNGDTAAVYKHQFLGEHNGTAESGRDTTAHVRGLNFMHSHSSNQHTFNVMFYLYAKTGEYRLGNTLNNVYESSNTNEIEHYCSTSLWMDTSTNITSLKIISETANGILPGCHFELWAYREIPGAGGTTTENVGFTEIKTSRDYEESSGVWRPIYVKMVSCGTLPNTTSSTDAHGISNISKVVSVIGNSSNGTKTIELPCYSTDLDVDSTNINLTTRSDMSAYTTTNAIIKYTKTTDSTTSSPRNN